MTAAVFDVLFEQGVGRPVVIANVADDYGNLADLTAFTGQLQIRPSFLSAIVLFERSTSAGNLSFTTTYGVDSGNNEVVTANSIETAFTDAEVAAMVPVLGYRPIVTLSYKNQTYGAGVWECRGFSSGGEQYSFAKGKILLALGVVR